MSFRFLHAADLHLASPLRGLRARDEALGQRLESASRQAFSELVRRAIDAEAAFFIIAGDVFDGQWRDYSIGLFYAAELEKLSQSGIPVYVLRGNHDAESIVTKSLRLPSSVYEFSTRRAQTFLAEHVPVALHGRGFSEREVREDLAQGYPLPVPGRFNIGVLHTSLDGREGHAPYAPTTPAILSAKGYDYWALGHVHAFEKVSSDPAIVYPGVLQARHIGETGAKGAVLVSVDEALRISDIERVIVDVARFERVNVDLTGATEHEDALSRIDRALDAAASDADGRPVVVRLRLWGETPLHLAFQSQRAYFEAEVQGAAQKASGDVLLESLGVETKLPASALAYDAEPSLDIEAIVSGALREPGLSGELQQALLSLRTKLPPEVLEQLRLDDPQTLGDLLGEAREVILGRLQGSQR
jgi:exonuclease SbcD